MKNLRQRQLHLILATSMFLNVVLILNYGNLKSSSPSPSKTNDVSTFNTQEGFGVYPIFKMFCGAPPVLNMQAPAFIRNTMLELQKSGKRKVIIDVGVHFGEEFFSTIDAGYTVLGFEPTPTSFEKILEKCKTVPNKCKNFDSELNQMQKNHILKSLKPGEGYVINAGAGSVATTLKLYGSENFPGNSFAEDFSGQGKFFEVPVLRISDLVDEDVFMLKIDVQGFEFEVLKGALDVFKKHTVSFLMLEVYPKGLKRAGVDFQEMFTFIRQELHMICSPASKFAISTPVSIPKFAEFLDNVAAKVQPGHYGEWDDLICFNVGKDWSF